MRQGISTFGTLFHHPISCFVAHRLRLLFGLVIRWAVTTQRNVSRFCLPSQKSHIFLVSLTKSLCLVFAQRNTCNHRYKVRKTRFGYWPTSPSFTRHMTCGCVVAAHTLKSHRITVLPSAGPRLHQPQPSSMTGISLLPPKLTCATPITEPRVERFLRLDACCISATISSTLLDQALWRTGNKPARTYKRIRPTCHGPCTGHFLPTQASPREELELEYLKFHERSCSYWVFNAEQSWLLGELTPLVVDHLYDEYLES